MSIDFEQRIPYLIRRVSTALAHHVDTALREFNLTHTQLGALAQLGVVDPEPLSGAVLGQRNGVTAQSMSTAISGLLERGLVDREAHPTHGRILQVRITRDGADLLAKAQTAIGRVEDRALAFLDEDQERELATTLRTMMREMGLYLYFPDAD